MQKIEYQKEVNTRIDTYLIEELQLSRSKIQNMIKEKKILVNDGVIESVHPSIFVVRLENDNQRTVTYSYSDVLTKTVSLYYAV